MGDKVKKDKTNHYSILHKQTLSESEKEGVEKLFSMMLSLRQQILLRSRIDKTLGKNYKCHTINQKIESPIKW